MAPTESTLRRDSGNSTISTCNMSMKSSDVDPSSRKNSQFSQVNNYSLRLFPINSFGSNYVLPNVKRCNLYSCIFGARIVKKGNSLKRSESLPSMYHITFATDCVCARLCV